MIFEEQKTVVVIIRELSKAKGKTIRAQPDNVRRVVFSL